MDELRLSFAGEGIPHGGNVGFELFDKPHIGQSEFSEHLNYLRALQGELARTIGQLESVRTARVHLVIPQHRLFVTDIEEASASVVLALRGGRPDSREIKAIIHLVSSAVEGLDPARVTVVDTRGNLLSDRPELTGATGIAVMEMQRAMETQMEERLQSMLDQVLGMNKSLVRASVSLNRNSRTIQRETYSPVTDGAGQGVLESQHRTVEKYDGARAAVGGAAGVPPTLWGTGGNNANRGGNSYAREENTTQYRVTKQTESETVQPGEIARISLALFVDKSVSDEQVTALKTMMAAAAGIDEKRGDQLAVEAIPFDTTAMAAEQQAEKQEAKRAMMTLVGRYGVSAILIVLFASIALALFKRTMAPPPRTVVAGGDEQPMYPMLPGGDHAVEQYALLSAPAEAALGDADVAPVTEMPAEDSLRHLEPQRVAAVIKSLMSEE
ncbi:MAG: Flagellar M-ring protein [bacterium ADurb.Bin429]|nr:MAG: Flagellar M-ring protein [bacterium ADurb.Bin429]